MVSTASAIECSLRASSRAICVSPTLLGARRHVGDSGGDRTRSRTTLPTERAGVSDALASLTVARCSPRAPPIETPGPGPRQHSPRRLREAWFREPRAATCPTSESPPCLTITFSTMAHRRRRPARPSRRITQYPRATAALISSSIASVFQIGPAQRVARAAVAEVVRARARRSRSRGRALLRGRFRFRFRFRFARAARICSRIRRAVFAPRIVEERAAADLRSRRFAKFAERHQLAAIRPRRRRWRGAPGPSASSPRRARAAPCPATERLISSCSVRLLKSLTAPVDRWTSCLGVPSPAAMRRAARARLPRLRAQTRRPAPR